MAKTKVIRPRDEDQSIGPNLTVFLAGTIDNGAVEPWAHQVSSAFAGQDVTFFDPRRDDWDPAIEKRARNPEFRHQVEWEISRLEASDVPFFNFLGGSISPITFGELCYTLASRSTQNIPRTMPVVVCPDDYWRKGNVEIMCQLHDVRVLSTMSEGLLHLKNALDSVR